MKLYELDEEILIAERAIEEYAIEHEGDITDCPFEKVLGDLTESKDEKILNLCVWIKNMISDSEAIKAEIKTLTLRKKALENKASRVKDYVSNSIEKGKKLSNSKVAISWRKSKSVLVACDADLLPKEYQKIKIETDKTALKDALKAGTEIDFCSIEENSNLQIE